MKFSLCFVAFFVTFLQFAVCTPIKQTPQRYDHFVVYKIQIQNEKQRAIIEKLAENYAELYNIWYDDPYEIHLMVSPKIQRNFLQLTQLNGLNIKQWITNVQRLIDAEQMPLTPVNNATFGWTSYNDLLAINKWLNDTIAAHPDVATAFAIGKSYEGRTIQGIKISYKSGNPGIFIESNIHAREWITSATATWFINELLNSTKTEVRQLAENYDWYIVPVLNVDGFAYTHETDRLWRKTRQPNKNSTCIGTDANRNFDTHWMEVGASKNPCSNTYAGPKAFSEPETKALANYISGIKQKINILLSFHSYGQYFISPYGHTNVTFPKNYNDMQAVGKAFTDAVRALPYKTAYKYGSSAVVLYRTSGVTPDWAYNTQNIDLAYTIEFRDKGTYGFVLPPAQIQPNCEETMAGILAMIKEANTLGYLKPKY